MYTLSHDEFPFEKIGEQSQNSVVIASENPDDIRDNLSHHFSTAVSWKTKRYHAFTQLGAMQNNAQGNNYIFRGLDYNISVQHLIIPKLNGLMYFGLQYKDFYRFLSDIYYQRKEVFFSIGLQFRYILSHHTQLKVAYQNIQNLHIKENSKIPSAYEYSQQLISTSIMYEY